MVSGRAPDGTVRSRRTCGTNIGVSAPSVVDDLPGSPYVFVGGVQVADGQPQDDTAIQFGVGDEDLAAAIDTVGKGQVVLVGSATSKAHQGQVADDQLPA